MLSPASRWLRCVGIAASTVFAFHGLASAADQDSTQALLARMSHAVAELNYQGSFVYERDGRLDSLRLFHAGGGNERERLIGLNGPRSEMVRAGDTITCSQDGAVVVLLPNHAGTRLLPLIPEMRGRSLDNVYEFDVDGEDRVAGYRARIVDIAPRDAWRYGYRLWIEEGTYLPLRSAVIDGARHVLEQFMFVTLDIGAAPKESDLVPGNVAGGDVPSVEQPLGHPPRFRVADLPVGFTFAGARQPAQGPLQVEHQLYTDGLAEVSVYVEPRDAIQPPGADRLMKRGVLGVYSRDAGAWKITVLGDVPRVTLERIARSVQAVPASPTSPAANQSVER